MSQTLPVSCPNNPLPRDLDLAVYISRPQTELATDMTLMCFLTPDAPFPPNNGRVRYYSTFTALAADTVTGSEMYRAGSAFFSQSVRPSRMAVGRVFDAPVSAGLLAGDIDFTALSAVSDGAFDISVNGTLNSITGLDFSGIKDVAGLASIIGPKTSSGLGVSNAYGTLALQTALAGSAATLDYAATPTSGTDVSGLLGLTEESGAQLWQGYDPEGLSAEASMVQTASRCNGSPVYGWAVDRSYRDTAHQKEMSDWAEPQTPAYFSACTNSVTAFNSADTTNIGYYAYNSGHKRTSVFYHNNPQAYPDVAYMAQILATNYSLTDSAKTMKFKQLEGIETVQVTETQLSALNARRINTYTAIGNNSRTVREGVQSADTWFTDSLVNLDNFREELQVEVYNVFLRRPKVPYTTQGQNMLVSAARKICAKYERNGVFAPREIESAESESGYTTVPATEIIPTLMAYATTSERASRLAPPIQIDAYEAGAIHKASIYVNVYN